MVTMGTAVLDPLVDRRGAPGEPEAPSSPRRSSLRTQTLVPFGVGLVVIVLLVGIGATLIAREAVDQELGARARTAARFVERTVLQSRARLGEDAARLARQSSAAEADDPAARRRLENDVIDFAIARRLGLVSLTAGPGTSAIDGRADWRRLALARELLRAAPVGGPPATGSTFSPRGEPIILAASAGRRREGRRVLVGRAIDRRMLGEVESSLGVLLQVRAPTRAKAPDPAKGLRTVNLPLRMTDGSFGRLDVTLSARPIRQTTQSALVAVAGVGLFVVVLLIALLSVLLRRSVLDPLGALRRGIERMRGGDYKVRLPLVGASEVRAVSDGFNRMCGLVGDQQGRLHALATTDSLTGLANHRSFHDALATASEASAREGVPFALIVVDLDRFKLVNDTCGHPKGDEILRNVAERLEALARESDVVGRLGGEEFGMLLPAADAESAFGLAERAREAIGGIEAPGFTVDSSAGVAACPEDARDGGRLLELADAALYQAKLAGRGRTCRFDPRVSGPGAVEERQAAVRVVLDDPGALRCVFQPVVELERGTIVGYEALSRFSPDDEMGPAGWFDLARSCALGPELQALAVARALAVPDRPEGTWLSVNLDPSVLGSEAVQDVLPDDLRGVVIEITEQELPSDDGLLQGQLTTLRERGALIALDDAGAGYAGLSHVVRVRPDIVKLDRTLVADVHRDQVRFALIEAFVSFARRTGAQVCAEGIETYEQLEALAEAEVMLGQGYRLARPGAPWVGVPAEIADRVRGRGSDGAAASSA